MENRKGLLHAWAGVVVAALALLIAGVAWGDPPGRVVRLGYMSGPVSFNAAGDNDWVQAEINRPLWTGDRIWTAAGARAELQMGIATLRMAPETSVNVVNFDDRTAQFQVTQGAVHFHVRTMDSSDVIEIDTPNLAFAIRRPGDYRVDVTPDGDSTGVAVLRGEAEAFGTQNAYVIAAGTRYRFRGTDLTDYQPEPIATRDPLDTWAAERVAIAERSQSARYVSPDTIGYADLDANGTWRNDPTYGPVWAPTIVAADWAPYRYGRWSWVDPWGWTWVDDAPWGFAPFHYGRWAYLQSRWCWVPGPRAVRPVYAPALVAFVGGNNWGASLSFGAGGGVGWFPLGPGDVYRPAYTTSREYFTRVNVTNTVVNVNNVTNIYNNPTTTNIRYVNATNVNAVTAVPTQAFVDARPVQRAAVKVDARAIQQAQVVSHVAVAPVKASIVGAAPVVQARPNATVLERQVIAKQAPPPASPSIAQREEALKRQPGRPLEPAEVQKLGAQAPAAARPNVKVVQPSAPPKPMSAAAPSTGRPQPTPPAAATAPQPPVAGAPPKAEEMRRGGPPPTAAGAEKQGPASGRPEEKGRSPTAAAPGARTPPTAMGSEKQGPPPVERGKPPPTEARTRSVPTPPGAAPETPGRAGAVAETPRPPQAANARPEPPARPMAQGQGAREPVQRPGAPPKEAERSVTPAPAARAPVNEPPQARVAPPPAARAPMNVPPQAQTPPQQRPESANVSRPPATVQAPPARPEAQARPAPREPAESQTRQAQAPPPAAQQGRAPAPPPQAAPQAMGRPAEKGPPPKERDNKKDENKKEENK